MAEELEEALTEQPREGGSEPDITLKARQEIADEGRIHHRIATDETERVHLRTWLNRPEMQHDPAYKVRQ